MYAGQMRMWLAVLILSSCSYGTRGNNEEPGSYYLYTPLNTNLAQQLFSGDVESVKRSHFNVQLPTKIVIHGWTMSHLKFPNQELRSAYQSRGEYNIIAVDWSDIASLDYLDAKNLAPTVGASCGGFVHFLVKEIGLDLAQLVLIGHSLGAHVAGFCGKELLRLSEGQLCLSNIVALDPAFPFYAFAGMEKRLATIDAKYVMVLHTNALIKGQLSPIGHADFYANGGRSQPGCGLDLGGRCAHARAVHLYAEAVRGYTHFRPYGKCKHFVNFLASTGHCDDTQTSQVVELGDPLEVPHVEGIFTFHTDAESPYGQVIRQNDD